MRGSALRMFLGFLGIVAVIAGVELFAVYTYRAAVDSPAATRPSAPAPTGKTAEAPRATAAPPVGAIDVPAAEAVLGPTVRISGWTLAPNGIRTVEIRVDGRAYPAKIGIARPDVAKIKTEFADRDHSGFEFSGDFSGDPPRPGADRRMIQVVAIGNDGGEAILGSRSLLDPGFRSRWAWLDNRNVTPFYLLPALSGIDLGGAAELDTVYAPYASATVRAGFRVPTLYLRMTRGAASDYAVRPRLGSHAQVRRAAHRRRFARRRARARAGDAAAGAGHAQRRHLGRRLLRRARTGTSTTSSSRTSANVQWNEKNEVMPDDHPEDICRDRWRRPSSRAR